MHTHTNIALVDGTKHRVHILCTLHVRIGQLCSVRKGVLLYSVRKGVSLYSVKKGVSLHCVKKGALLVVRHCASG